VVSPQAIFAARAGQFQPNMPLFSLFAGTAEAIFWPTGSDSGPPLVVGRFFIRQIPRIGMLFEVIDPCG